MNKLTEDEYNLLVTALNVAIGQALIHKDQAIAEALEALKRKLAVILY